MTSANLYQRAKILSLTLLKKKKKKEESIVLYTQWDGFSLQSELKWGKKKTKDFHIQISHYI